MINIYKNNEKTNDLKEIKKIENNVWINLVNPTEKEINTLSKKLKIDKSFFLNVLDEEETSRIEKEDDAVLILLDIPINEKVYKDTTISTIPLGIIIVNNEINKCVITICLKETDLIKDIKTNKVKNMNANMRSRFIIQIVYKITTSYLKHLRIIDKEIDKAERLLYKETKNSNLLKLLNLSKSLVYIETALRSNSVVLNYLLKGNVIQLYDEDAEMLEDAIIENKQGLEMAKIYGAILDRLTSAFASIISNNLNDVMRFLAGITIVISIPTMIASFMGMNVNFGSFAEKENSLYIILGIAFLISLLVAFILKKKDIL